MKKLTMICVLIVMVLVTAPSVKEWVAANATMKDIAPRVKAEASERMSRLGSCVVEYVVKGGE